MPITSAITGGLSCDNSFLALSRSESFSAETVPDGNGFPDWDTKGACSRREHAPLPPQRPPGFPGSRRVLTRQHPPGREEG